MTFLGILVFIFSGLPISIYLNIYRNNLEKWALSLLLGSFMVIMSMFLLSFFSLCSLPFIIIFSILINAAVIYFLQKESKLKAIWDVKIEVPKFSELGWYFCIGLTIYLVYGIGEKCLFWPIAEYDSMTGYDLMAKMIANEGTFNTTIFQYPYKNAYDVARFIYPPLVASGLAFFYMLGADNAKIIMLIWFISFIICFYNLLARKINLNFAAFFTLLMIVTPEFFSHTALGLTNLPNAIFTSLSVLYLLNWFEKGAKNYLYTSLILMSASMWSRSDSVIFIVAFGLVFAIQFLKNKEWKLPLIYVSVLFVFFMMWSLFIKLIVGVNSADFFVKTLFWDAQKLQTILSNAFGLMLGNGMLYGLTFYLFVIFFALNIVDIIIQKNEIVIFTLSSWALYTFLFYQIDYGFAGSIEAYLNASYKRGLFNFIPLIWYFVAFNPLSNKFYNTVNQWITK